jgi:type I restriction enzyme S subunit
VTTFCSGVEAVPPGWRVAPLGDVAEQCLGKMLDAAKNKGRPLPYLRNPNVRWFKVDTSDLKAMPFEDHEQDRYGLAEGDVLICEGGEAGRAAIWDGRIADMKFQKALHRIRTGPDLLNRFLVHKLKADYDSGRLSSYYTGATIKHLTGQDLLRYQLLLPPIAEQRRIADILDRAERLRAMRRAAIARLGTLTQSIFLDMFGDPAANVSAWPSRTLAELCASREDIRCGPFGTQLNKSAFRAEGVPLWGIKHVNRAFEIPTTEFLEPETAARLSQYSLESGDIVMTRKGTIGNCAVYPTHATLGIMHSDLLRIRLDRRSCDPAFLSHQLQHSGAVARQLSAMSGGAVMPGINVGRLKALEVLVPPLHLQTTFATRIAALQMLRAVHRRAADEVDALCTSIQHRAFRGQL